MVTVLEREVDSRRLAIMNVPREFVFFHLFAQPLDGKAKVITPVLYYAMNGQREEVDWRTCEIVEVQHDWQRGTFGFKLRSAAFNPVPSGDVIPYLDFALEETLVDVITPETQRQTFEQWNAERAEVVAKLRNICNDHGDNDWPDEEHLADVVEKHLGDYLDAEEAEDDSEEIVDLDDEGIGIEIPASWLNSPVVLPHPSPTLVRNGATRRIVVGEFAKREEPAQVLVHGVKTLTEAWCGPATAGMRSTSNVASVTCPACRDELQGRLITSEADLTSTMTQNYVLRGRIGDIEVQARWEEDAETHLRRLAGGAVPDPRWLVALCHQDQVGTTATATFEDFMIQVRYDSRDSFQSTGRPLPLPPQVPEPAGWMEVSLIRDGRVLTTSNVGESVFTFEADQEMCADLMLVSHFPVNTLCRVRVYRNVPVTQPLEIATTTYQVVTGRFGTNTVTDIQLRRGDRLVVTTRPDGEFVSL